MKTNDFEARFHILEEDLLHTDLPRESFDIITNISVIEHFQNDLDTHAMRLSACLLKPGGRYILTTLINEGYFKEFFLRRSIYGESFEERPLFYQRHYDLHHLKERILRPSELEEARRIFFGDYGFQAFEILLQKPPKVLRALYQWSTSLMARNFLSYSQWPVSRRNMKMNTASGVILILTKPKV